MSTPKYQNSHKNDHKCHLVVCWWPCSPPNAVSQVPRGRGGHKRTDMTQPMFWMSTILSKRLSTMELIRPKSKVFYILDIIHTCPTAVAWPRCYWILDALKTTLKCRSVQLQRTCQKRSNEYGQLDILFQYYMNLNCFQPNRMWEDGVTPQRFKKHQVLPRESFFLRKRYKMLLRFPWNCIKTEMSCRKFDGKVWIAREGF